MAPKRIQRVVRWLAGASALILPACASVKPDPPSRTPLPTRLADRSRIAPTISGVIPASGQVNADDVNKPNPATSSSVLPPVPPAALQGKPLPITLPTALSLTNAAPLDIQIASEGVRAASAAFSRARVLWLPNIDTGVDYYRQDGKIQQVAGQVFTTSKSSLLIGAGPTAVVPVSDALYAPLAARQVVRAQQATRQAARNDTTLSVAEAYFTVQQARGEVAGAIDTLRRADELVKLTEKVAPSLVPTLEVNRAKVEVAKQRQAVETAYERWQVASAELTRLLRLEPGTLVEPTEEPSLVVELLAPDAPIDELIPIALTHRPELAAHQALIQAALARVRQEKARPFIPTVALRGMSSQFPGLAGGYFGGGVDGNLTNFGGRYSFDLQAIWEVQNLGFGNRAIIREREAERRQAFLRLLRTHDIVIAEVTQAQARLSRSSRRLKAAEEGVANAVESAEKNLRGLVPGKRVGDQLTLVVRPQEAVAAVAALDQAYRDYYAAVGDNNRAQFQLYRALGHPAQSLTSITVRPALIPAIPEMPEPKPPVVLPEVPVSASKPAPAPLPGSITPPAPTPLAPPVIVLASQTEQVTDKPIPDKPDTLQSAEPLWQAAGSGQLRDPRWPAGQSPPRP